MQPQPPRIVLPNDSTQAAIENLRAPNAHSGYEEKLRTFGQFIGVWDMDIQLFNKANEIVYHQPGVWMFSWILDGRAIQDVIVGPPRSNPANGERRIGTTIRYYDEVTKRWHITFMTPTGQIYIHLEGGQRGDTIVLEGKDTDGSALRWMFTDITPQSFHWRGYTSPDDGKTWHLEQEMFAKRRTPVKTEEHSAWWYRNGKFRSEISVDSMGLVRNYPPAWEPLTSVAAERRIAANEAALEFAREDYSLPTPG